MSVIATQPLKVAGTATVVRFNWPKYVAVIGILAAAFMATVADLPRLVCSALGVVGGAGLFWAATSLVATWWVYDYRRVYDQVAIGIEPVGDWASVHAGFDDATANLVAAIGREPQAVVELSMQASPSLRRARRVQGRVATAGAVGCLALMPSSLDSIFVTFAAHEIRDGEDQRALFGELHRALRPGGHLVVTEHLRDAANFIVYGPAAFHFQPASTWINRADEAGFDIESDVSITPFVHRLIWQR